ATSAAPLHRPVFPPPVSRSPACLSRPAQPTAEVSPAKAATAISIDVNAAASAAANTSRSDVTDSPSRMGPNWYSAAAPTARPAGESHPTQPHKPRKDPRRGHEQSERGEGVGIRDRLGSGWDRQTDSHERGRGHAEEHHGPTGRPIGGIRSEGVGRHGDEDDP